MVAAFCSPKARILGFSGLMRKLCVHAWGHDKATYVELQHLLNSMSGAESVDCHGIGKQNSCLLASIEPVKAVCRPTSDFERLDWAGLGACGASKLLWGTALINSS